MMDVGLEFVLRGVNQEPVCVVINLAMGIKNYYIEKII